MADQDRTSRCCSVQKTDIDNVGSLGVIKDIDDTKLPNYAWTDVRNMRFESNHAIKMSGDESVFEGSVSLLGNPTTLMPVRTTDTYFWVYAAEHAIYATDGDSHANITEVTGGATASYSTTPSIRWNGGVLNGLAVLNNSFDAPVYWNPSLSIDVDGLPYDNSAGTTWADITAAPRCAVMRPFKSQLIALDITESGTRNQRQVWWSHTAEAGSLPDWDYTRTDRLAGQNELAETQGIIIDCLPLRDDLCIYKSDSIFRMTYIGLPDVFAFRKEIDSVGMIGRDCVGRFFGSHLMFGTSDIVMHNFNEINSIVDKSMRSWIFNQISSTTYDRSFVAMNYPKNEAWFCFPSAGTDYPNLALVWNWEENTRTVRELDNAVCAAYGVVDPSVESTSFDSQVGTFDSDSGAFNETAFNPALTRTLIGQRSDASSPKILLLDETNTFNGTTMTSYMVREALPLGRLAPDGITYVDMGSMKTVTRIIPRLRGSGVVEISVGTQDYPGGPVNWREARNFTIGTDRKKDFRVTGRLIAVRFRSTTDITWSMDSYRVEWRYSGER